MSHESGSLGGGAWTRGCRARKRRPLLNRAIDAACTPGWEIGRWEGWPPPSDANPTQTLCCPPGWGQTKRDSRLIPVSPCAARCRREDSTLHSLNGNQVLNLARLPVPPLRHGWEG